MNRLNEMARVEGINVEHLFLVDMYGDLVKTESMNNPMRKKKKTISTPKMSDWVEHYDDTHGRLFFHNEKTGETTWERPRTKGGVFGFSQRTWLFRITRKRTKSTAHNGFPEIDNCCKCVFSSKSSMDLKSDNKLFLAHAVRND